MFFITRQKLFMYMIRPLARFVLSGLFPLRFSQPSCALILFSSFLSICAHVFWFNRFSIKELARARGSREGGPGVRYRTPPRKRKRTFGIHYVECITCEWILYERYEYYKGYTHPCTLTLKNSPLHILHTKNVYI